MSESLPSDELEPERYELHALPPLTEPNRRQFFATLGAGLVVVVWSRTTDAAEEGPQSSTPPSKLSAWIHIGSDGRITVFSGKAEVGQRSEVSARTDASRLRNHRNDAGVEHRHQRLGECRAHSTGGTEQNIGSEQHHGPHDFGWQGIAHSGGVASDQVELQGLELIGLDPNRRELAETGVDPVQRATPRDGLLHCLAAPFQGGQGLGCDGHGRAGRSRHRHDVIEAQGPPVE